MSYPSQTPPYFPTPTGNETDSNLGATDFPEFSTQMALGGIRVFMKPFQMQRIQLLLVGEVPNGPLIKIWFS